MQTTKISLSGSGPEVLAQHNPLERWNGFVCPRIDALSAVQVLDYLAEEGEGVHYSFDEDGALQVIEGDDEDTWHEETYSPDEDGLYALGSHGWVWTEV